MRAFPARLLIGLAALGLAAALVPSADAQKRGGTLTIVRPTDPVSLDPNLETTAPGAWVYFNMLEGLLTLDDKVQVKPALATSYEVMSPTKVRFKLRPNVKFHDGTPFNAAAVKFTYDRALKGTPPARWASLVGSMAGAEVVDDLTVDIVTKEPYGPILRTLAMYCMGIVSPTAVQKLGADFSRAPVGTGPFKFVEWKEGDYIALDKNPSYWETDASGGKLPYLDKVLIKFIIEPSTLVAALKTGEVDGINSVAPQFGHRIQKHRKGIRRRVSPKSGENPRFGTTFAPPASLSVWAYALFTPKRFCASWSKALWKPAREPNSITRNMMPSPTKPM